MLKFGLNSLNLIFSQNYDPKSSLNTKFLKFASSAFVRTNAACLLDGVAPNPLRNLAITRSYASQNVTLSAIIPK